MMLNGETLEPGFSSYKWSGSPQQNHYYLRDGTRSLEHQLNSASYIPGKSFNPPKTPQKRHCYSHFTCEKIETQGSDLPKVTLLGSDRAGIRICASPALLGRKFLLMGALSRCGLGDNFVKMAFLLYVLVN